ncbi:MAG TPA: sigma-70 family RNA polymerase sigma factor [Terracidiphilus sp.]
MKHEERDNVSAAAAAIPITMIQTSDQLAQLFADHHRRVLVAAYRVTGSMADAEDVAQTVFLRLGRGEGIPMKNAGSYLYRAAVNGALDLLRRRKIAAVEPIDAAEGIASMSRAASPDAELTRAELAGLLRRAISELPGRAAEMFTLRYIEELGNREIATLMGTSSAVVAVTLHQTRSRLKKTLIALQRGKS